MRCDILLLCPFGSSLDSAEGLLDREMRVRIGPVGALILEARHEFQAELGCSLAGSFFGNRKSDKPLVRLHDQRSCTAMTLATHLERAGLSWRILDPGPQELHVWRTALESYARELQPRVIGISTTFLTSPVWTRSLFRIAREAFPSAKVIAGGYLYASDPTLFLSLDADVFVVGEGEIRLPQIVKRLNDAAPLDDIRGIYFSTGGKLKYTGPAEPLSMRELPPIDWTLAARIDPPVALAQAPVQAWIETQRGCVFKCEFCTYRTLASPELASVESAAERILAAAAAAPNGYVYIADATATYPSRRWEAIMHKLIASGGSPRPIWAFARVSDIDEHIAGLMAKAGVRHVFIGQESGDQRILNAMKKGTRVEHIAPAIAGLARHGLTVTMSLIHGFPGETPQSIARTRELLLTVNAGCARPVVVTYILAPFVKQAFASVGHDMVTHKPSPDSAQEDMSGEDLQQEYFKTLIAVSKVRNAPLAASLFPFGEPVIPSAALAMQSDMHEVFTLSKAFERGITMFLERKLFGAAIEQSELRQVKQLLLGFFARKSSWLGKVRERQAAGRLRALSREWTDERLTGRAGRSTRLLIALVRRRAFGLGLGETMATYRTGNLDDRVVGADGVQALGRQLIEEAVVRGRSKLKMMADGGSLERGPAAAGVGRPADKIEVDG
jgi:hypothetical protein